MNSYHIDTLPFSIQKGHPNKFDTDGVILSKIPYTQNYNYHVTAISSYAICNIEDKKKFSPQIKWLINNINDNGAYIHNFTLPFYENFPKKWIGGLAQGLAISALIRAYRKTNDKNYLITAKSAFKCLKNNCIYVDEFGDKWIEEYPIHPPLHILNGYIYAAFGIYDLLEEIKDKNVEKIWQETIETLIKNISKYDIGYWSYYSLKDSMPSTEFYHRIHIKQLNKLNQIYPNDELKKYADKWKHNLDASFNKLRVGFDRNYKIIKHFGLRKAYNKYFLRKKWLNG